MTVSSQISTAGPYTGNGATTSFPFAFQVFTSADLDVVRTDTDGVETSLVVDVDYTVSLNANQYTSPGGTVECLTAPPTGYLLTLLRSLESTQGASLQNQGGFYPKVIENALDKLTILIQQVVEVGSRALKFPVSDGTVNPTLPAKDLRKGRVLAFHETTGDPAQGPSIASVNTVAGAVGAIQTVSDNIADVNTTAGSIANVNTVAGAVAAVNTVAGISANVTTVAGVSANVSTVAGISGNVTTVAGISANVTTVAGIAAAVSTVAGNIVAVQGASAAADAAAASAVAADASEAAAFVSEANAGTSAAAALVSQNAAAVSAVAAEAAKDTAVAQASSMATAQLAAVYDFGLNFF